VSRGHTVLVHTGARFEQRARRTGAGFAPLPEAADFDDRDLAARFPERGKLPAGGAQMAFDVMHLFGDVVPAQYQSLRRLVREFSADFVINEMQFFGALPLSLDEQRQGHPVTITVGIQPPVFQSVDTAPFGAALLPLAGEPGRVRNRALEHQFQKAMTDLQQYLDAVFAKVGVRLEEILSNATASAPDHYLQLTVPGFEYPRSDAPESYRCIGAITPEPVPGFETPDWWAELSGERPVVVVTQGTFGNQDLGTLLLPTLRALDGAEVIVVAATARADGPEEVRAALGELPANVRLGGFLPFDRLLPLADVLVTNGGYGGVHAALRHGVPLVVAGEGEDKPEVAARVEWSGAGLNLRSGRPGKAALREAVQTVLSRPSYRTRARQLQAQFAEYDPLAAIAELVGTAAAT